MNHTLPIPCGAIVLLPIGLSGQDLSGMVLAADSGRTISDATVLAVQQMALAKQKPVIYKVQTDEAGRYGISAAVGVYKLCGASSGGKLRDV